MKIKYQHSYFGELAVIDFPPVLKIDSSKVKKNQVLHLIQIDDEYVPKSILINRTWNINLQ